MHQFFCALLLGSALLAQQQLPALPDLSEAKGMFHAEGIAYHYTVGKDYLVVAAAQTVINRKFLAVKVRFYNTGSNAVTVNPENILVEDAIAGHPLAAVSAASIAEKMRKTPGMAAYAVGGETAGGKEDNEVGGTVSSELILEMMRAMAPARRPNPGAKRQNPLFTDVAAGSMVPLCPFGCDLTWKLSMRESHGSDTLAKLQGTDSTDYVERCGLGANTIAPDANVSGVLYFPLGKLMRESMNANSLKKTRIVRMTIPLGGESFQFVLPVE